jgi:Ras-related protein Rab-11A
MESQYTHRKVVMLGPQMAGKTVLLSLIRNDGELETDLPDTYMPTIGVDFAVRMCLGVKLQVWEIGGHRMPIHTYRAYTRAAAVVLLVFDASRQASFDELSWYLDVASKNAPHTSLVLVALKSDLVSDRQVPRATAQAWAAAHCNGFYTEVSALTDPESVDALVLGVAELTFCAPSTHCDGCAMLPESRTHIVRTRPSQSCEIL